MKKVNLKEAKGITLVALVITVIILLILAGVALSLVIGENGLIAKSKKTVEKYKDKSTDEKWQLEDFEAGMEEISLDELEDEEKHPELQKIKLVLNIDENNTEIRLPAYPYESNQYKSYKYDCTVNWGDNTEKVTVTNENSTTITHTYNKVGRYTVEIEGIYEILYVAYDDSSIQQALIKIEQWGSTGLQEVRLAYCENLTEIATPSKNSFVNVTSFYETFKGCSNLQSIPERLFANCPDVTSFSGTFSECSSLQSIPERLFTNCPNVTDFDGTFEVCTGLTSIPERLFANCPNVTDFDGTFKQCIGLTSIPINLFDNCLNATRFYGTFEGCVNLKGKSIDLWNRNTEYVNENRGGNGCYRWCENLEDYNSIPDYWKYGEDE